MCKDIGHNVVDWIYDMIVDILKISLLKCGYNILYKGLLKFSHFSKEIHFFGVHDAHVGVRVGGCSVQDNNWTRVSKLDEGRVWYEKIFCISDNWTEMAMKSSSEIVVDGFHVCLDFIPILVESFESGFTTDWSGVWSLE